MQAKLYKLIFDISICCTFGAFFLKAASGITLHGSSFLILLILALISVLLDKRRKLKIFAIILLPIIFLAFFLPAVPELVVFLLIWAYFFYVTIKERFVIRREDFLDMIKRFLCLCLFLVILVLAVYRNFGTSMQAACPYLVTAMVSAVFLLRQLRAENQMEQMKEYKWQQFMELLVFLIISLLLTLIRVPQNLMEGLKLMYQYLLGPILAFIGSIIGVLVGGIFYLGTAILAFFTNNQQIREINSENGKTEKQIIIIPDAKSMGAWVMPLIYSAGAILGLVLLFFFFRWLMGEKMKQKVPTGILETKEYLDDTKVHKAVFRKRRPKDPRETIRYYYGKCLLWLKHKHVELRPQDTTEEINNKYYNLQTDNYRTKKEASAQFMQIYRKARYGIEEQITKEEAEKAKQLYQEIKTHK
jgi:hypothetical protein